MVENIESKLRKINRIWNDFVWEYKFVSKKINFTQEIKTNYFGDLVKYFDDTLKIIFDTEVQFKNKYDNFLYIIGLLQAIYIQQDLIIELLYIFKLEYNKTTLKEDNNYSENRDLRNKLIGHPINRRYNETSKKREISSSSFFDFQTNKNEIHYIIHHKKNKFVVQNEMHFIKDIKERHYDFLEIYLNKILTHLEKILKDYSKKLNILKKVTDTGDFSKILKMIDIYLEAFYKSNYIYDRVSIEIIYNRRTEHLRYNQLINNFIIDLKKEIIEKQEIINELTIKNEEANIIIEDDLIEEYADSSEVYKLANVDFLNEIINLMEKRCISEFWVHAKILKDKIGENKLILDELKHMEDNFKIPIEYYSSLNLIIIELEKIPIKQ